MDTFNVGDKVLTSIGETGVVYRIRYDERSNPTVITVRLDNPAATPDGFYYARGFELKKLS